MSLLHDTDLDLIARYAHEPAPLLAILHAFQDRDGWLEPEVLQKISKRLRIPLAELSGTLSFYEHFRTSALPPEKHRASEYATDELQLGLAPLPPVNPGGHEECVFAHLRAPARKTLTGYRTSGGFEALAHTLRTRSPKDLRELVTASGLAGRGGAGFPTGKKWNFVAEAPGSVRYVIANADEGEPFCAKDRPLLDHDPFALLEGMALAAYGAEATVGIIYLRYEYPDTVPILEQAIAACEAHGFLGERILGSPFGFRIHLRRAAGSYLCGEETALLESLEGRRPFPRNRPPYPAQKGLYAQPTLIQNIETLCAVPPIVRRGPEWYQKLGRPGFAGTKIISVFGDVQRPGNYEVPFGLPMRTLLEEWAGGALAGRRLVAATMAGLSGGLLAAREFDVAIAEPALRQHGCMLGAGGVLVLDDSRDLLAMARETARFFAHESCGKCFPCRIGTQRLVERFSQLDHSAAWRSEVEDLIATMAQTSACGLGQAAATIPKSLLDKFLK